MRQAVAAVVLALGMTALPETAGPSLGADPANFNKLYSEAQVKNDVEFFKAIIADDFKFIQNDQKTTFNKAQWLEFIGKADYKSRTITQDQVEQHGNIVIATAFSDIYYKSRPTGLRQVQMRIYQLGNDKVWRQISQRTISEVPLPAPTTN